MKKIETVLVSQPKPVAVEKSPYWELSTKFGVNIDYTPFIRVEGVNLKEYRAQRTDIMEHSAVIFTSRTTVDHFFRMCEEARITPSEEMKYICKSEVVALYLQKYIVYRKRKISFSDGSFSDFMEIILKRKREKMMLVLSEPYTVDLPTTMKKMGLNFSKTILSRTVSADLSGLKMRDYDILVFFSPSEIASLVAQFDTGKLPLIATFGDATTRAAIEAGLEVAIIAPTLEAPSMAKAVENFIEKYNSGEQPLPPDIEFGRKKSDEFLESKKAKRRGRTPSGRATTKASPTPKTTTTKPKSSVKGGTTTAPKPTSKQTATKSVVSSIKPISEAIKSTADSTKTATTTKPLLKSTTVAKKRVVAKKTASTKSNQ